MKKKVLFVVLEGFADWEYGFAAAALQGSILDKESPYTVETVSVGSKPVKSLGGFHAVPDYDVAHCPEDFTGLVLIGGTSWRSDEAKAMAALTKMAYESGKVVAAICDATVFLGMNGLLNEKKHTSNNLKDLSAAAGENYTGRERYLTEEAARDGNLVTANGTGYLEFTRELLIALNAYPEDYIESNYQFFKQGYIAMSAGMA